jgi:cell division protein FtsB
MKRIVISLVATFLGLIIGYSGYTYRANHLRLKLELQQTQQQKQELDNKLNETTQEKEQLKKQNDDLQIQLQSKKQQQAVLASATRRVAVTQPTGAVFSGSGDQYLDWIISKESGGNSYAVNASSGACGLGQSLPCSKVLNACGSLSNVQCQIDWVHNYTIARYGSPYNAYIFWTQNHWY